jgi:hypothetical protein
VGVHDSTSERSDMMAISDVISGEILFDKIRGYEKFTTCFADNLNLSIN